MQLALILNSTTFFRWSDADGYEPQTRSDSTASPRARVEKYLERNYCYGGYSNGVGTPS